jgi:PAS domain S-box-containing protein
MAEPRTKSNQAVGSVALASAALLDARGEAPKFKRIFEHSPVPMVIVDAERRYVEANRPARLTFRLRLDEVRTFTVDDFTPTHLTRDMEQAWTRLLEAGSVTGRYQMAGRHGSRLDFVYRGLAQVLPGLQLLAFAPADWVEVELDATDADRPDPAVSLTPREIEVLALAAEGYSGPELARALVLSRSTVSTHFKNIYVKLDVRNRGAAVAKAIRLGVID